MRYLLLLTLVVCGCGAESYQGFDSAKAPATGEANMESLAFSDSSEAVDAESSPPPPGTEKLRRKIIYKADVDLVVEDFSPVPEQVVELAKRFGGYIASSTLHGLPGSPRTGEWTIRVPVANYDALLSGARELGEVRRSSTNTQDVSEEYYDLQARIRNKKLQEDRLLKLLADATGKLEEVLKVERELARVREEIERFEGRKRVLDDLTSMTTVNLRVDEIKDYVPEEAASYGTRIRRAFSASITALGNTAEEVSIIAVVLSPWLGVLLVAVLVLLLLVKILRKRKS